MDKAKKARRFHWPSTRRLIQLYSALLYNAHLRGFIEGKIYQGNAKYLCVPGLNCYSCPGAVGACPLGAIQNALASAGHRAGWYVLGMILLYGVILGRTICGWLCPLGLLQELLYKIPTPKIRKSRLTRILSWLKYLILAVFVIAIPLYYGLKENLPLPAFCKYICPAGTSEGAVALLAHPANASLYNMLGSIFTQKIIILLILLVSCIFCYRLFCRFLCPLGAVYSLFNRFNIVGIKVNPDSCIGCGKCVRVCPMDIRRVGDRECISCGKCMEACGPGAISLKAGKILLKGPETENAQARPEKRKKTNRIFQASALAVLLFALLWFNVLDPSLHSGSAPVASPVSPAETYVSDAPAGFHIGEQLTDFTLSCYDGTEFHLADCRGKITFINLWATYCTPCIRELPYFNDLCALHGEDTVVICIHPSMVAEDPKAFLGDEKYLMRFATDTEDAAANAIGAAGMLPQTVVLNRKGEVIYNAPGSVTPDILSDLYGKANEQP